MKVPLDDRAGRGRGSVVLVAVGPRQSTCLQQPFQLARQFFRALCNEPETAGSDPCR